MEEPYTPLTAGTVAALMRHFVPFLHILYRATNISRD